jgi:hypothetical protein
MLLYLIILIILGEEYIKQAGAKREDCEVGRDGDTEETSP